jgi:hypothetical protein
MRELTKSLFGFSLAMTLLGLEQLRHLLEHEAEGDHREDRIRGDLDNVRSAAEQHFGERAQRLYESGERFQRELLDLLFDIAKSERIKPDKVVNLAADMAEKSAESLRKIAKGKGSGEEPAEDYVAETSDLADGG